MTSFNRPPSAPMNVETCETFHGACPRGRNDWPANSPPPRKTLLRRARPGGKHDLLGSSSSGADQSCARPGQARHGASATDRSRFSLSITARRGQAPDVADHKSLRCIKGNT
jgi:hypothetical protein